LASLLLVILHSFFAKLAFHYKWIGFIVKGKSKFLLNLENKNILEMKKNNITDEDLIEILRIKMNIETFDDIKKAILERNGEISFIKKGQ